MIENIVIGKPLVDLHHLLGENKDDTFFLKSTLFTNERFLPNILKELGLIKSSSWVRKNKPNLMVELNETGCIDIQLSKKKKPIHIIIGE